jgi:hypothetical protein
MALILPSTITEQGGKEPLRCTLSEACCSLINMPQAGGIQPFSLQLRRAFKIAYDCDLPNIAVVAGRQIGKSTFLGNRMLIKSILVPYLKSLYVSPTQMQTKKFSSDRLEQPVFFSPRLMQLKGGAKHDAIMEKKFNTGSSITLRYAFLSANRLRGIPADNLYIDEYQDILPEVIPIIESCLHNASPEMRSKCYAGTFKSVDNPLTYLMFDESSLHEWVVPCHKHPFTHWNVLGYRNISRKGLVCELCGNPIDNNSDECRWANVDANPEKEKHFIGIRLPQIACSFDPEEVYWNMMRYDPAQFHNEILALPYDSGMRPLTLQQLQESCSPEIFMGVKPGSRDINYFKEMSKRKGAYAGVDWGSGHGSYTILTIATYNESNRFVPYYYKQYRGVESDPEFVLDDLMKKLQEFHVSLVGLDYGYGFGMNDRVLRQFGPDRAFKFEHVSSKDKAIWDNDVARYKIDRTEVMSDMFNAIKRKDTITFPRFDDFYDPFGKHFLAIFSEDNKSTRRIQYSHPKSSPDDAFHATLYAFLVSCLHYPKPHFFAPIPVTGLKHPMES